MLCFSNYLIRISSSKFWSLGFQVSELKNSTKVKLVMHQMIETNSFVIFVTERSMIGSNIGHSMVISSQGVEVVE